MTSSSESGAKMRADAGLRMRELPSVDELLGRTKMRELIERAGRGIVTQAVRDAVAGVRERLKSGAVESSGSGANIVADIEARVAAEVEDMLAASLRRVINATGVILHTNLGRAPLAAGAAAEIAETATRYSNLEYDAARGERGKRDVHTARLAAEMAGAESALVVNNNAAAVFLVLNTLAKDAEVVVSRGELIEIGDGFRIPDIMSASGATLSEVGTTNRTSIRDYERAINERTRLLLRVHPSNFRITGFTERVSLEELVALGRSRGIPVFEDLGSGCLADLSGSGVAEPVVKESCAAGASVVSFSGDKLLGGPQAGIIAGQKEIVERIRRNPLFRALRVDKLTIAALEVTLRAYQRGAFDEIPALRMIRMTPEEIGGRAADFALRLRNLLPANAKIEIREGFSVIGGGSTPDQQLSTHLISVSSARHSAAALEERLRIPLQSVPVVARIEDDLLVLDLRTVFADEEATLASALADALA
jgi:L-seryl-tRNA(Ser) seleniumtransferase